MTVRCSPYLAALTGQEPIVVSRHFISAHGTQLFQVFVIRVFHNLQCNTCY